MTADYGSTFFVVVFVQELVLLGFLIVAQWRATNDVELAQVVAEFNEVADDAADEHDEALDEETSFLYDVAARDNERLVQNIDALDTTLIAIVVGIVAVSLFAGDKFNEFQPADRFAGILAAWRSGTSDVAGLSFGTHFAAG